MANLAEDGNYGSLPTEAAELPQEMVDLRPVPRVSIQGFCTTQLTSKIVESAGEDRRMTKAHLKVHPGGISGAIDYYAQAPTPNVIVVESEEAPEQLLMSLDGLAEYCDAGTKVIVIGHVNDVSLYRELMHRGVSEYLVAPINVYQFISSVSELFGDPQAEPLGKTIAFFGVKGGCGASTVAHNAAWSIARNFNNDVAIADLDLPFGTAGLDFNQDPLQGVFEAVSAPERLDETFLDRILSKCSEHLSLLAAPASLERTYDYDETAFDGLVDTMRNSTPAIVLDVPHGWNGWIKNSLVSADDVVLVAEPDLANLRNAKNVVDTLRQLRPNDRPPYLVMNRVNIPKRPEIKPAEFASALNLDVLVSIPFEPHLFGTAANNGQMISELEPKSPVSGMFNDVANAVTGRTDPKKNRKSPISSLLAKLKG